MTNEQAAKALTNHWQCIMFKKNNQCSGECKSCKWYIPTEALCDAYNTAIERMTPARWIIGGIWSEGGGMGEQYGNYYTCSKCGNTVKGSYKECLIEYCKNCGSKMEG